MTPCYYCEADDAACKTCIHSDTYIDPQEEITKLREPKTPKPQNPWILVILFIIG